MKIKPENRWFLEVLEIKYPGFCAEFYGNTKIMGKVPVSP
jgi:hypothetical protein